jgi:integrative and conjugative element protein (TIGR02256 family)
LIEEPHQPWPLIFAHADGTRFEVSAAAWQAMQCFIQHADNATEAGGVLLGRHLLDGSAIVVDAVTAPMDGDRRARTRFHRAQQRHQAAIDAAWATSDGTCTYLGEWHMHPEPIPSPSSVDWADWRRRLCQDRYTEPIFLSSSAPQRLGSGKDVGRM